MGDPTLQWRPPTADDSEPTYSYEPACVRGEGIQGDGFYGCDGQIKCGKNDKGQLFHVWAHVPDWLRVESRRTVLRTG